MLIFLLLLEMEFQKEVRIKATEMGNSRFLCRSRNVH